ncbi:hypothetical protein ACIHEI_23285 [Kitasatospora sp. NPDC051984]|uniref:hypothetical protein n=1 Tax=Kitasatospora sp. NPDC051984 TaxID=3364059 RepID=UPI0037CBCB6B
MTTPNLPANTRRGRLRTLICAGTIAATLPYLTLKAAWVAGSSIGVHGDGMHSGAMIGANLATLGMDAIAAALALALARPWGRRIPGWLLILPMWVATGLLAPIALVVPVAAVVGALTDGFSSSGNPGQDFIDGWVYALVYGGFGLQALGLVAGFVLHARERWAGVFTLRLRDLPTGPAAGARRLIAAGVAAFGLIPVGIQLSWAFGSHALRPGDTRTASQSLIVDSGYALIILAGLIAMLAVTRQRQDGRPALRWLITAWVGTGTAFGWGFFWLITSSLSTPLNKGDDMRGLALVGGFQTLAGAVLATVLALMVVQAAAAPAGQGASEDGGDRSGMIPA